jgi:hypothetical protein
VRGRLPMGVRWTNQIFPKNYYVRYNPNTREIKWSIKKVKGFIGYKTEPKTLSFQVGYTPVLNEVGSEKILVTDQEVYGTDMFTDKYILFKTKQSTTDLSKDKAEKSGAGIVQEKKVEDNSEESGGDN